jgi:hypothetical protein
VVNTDPCAAQVARKFDAKQPALVQAANKTESSVPAWAFLFFGVVAMFSFVSFVAVRARRRTSSTRQIQFTEPAFDVEALLVDEETLE